VSVVPLEPSVELRFNPTDLRPADLPRAGAYLGSPSEALEAALAVTRASVVNQMRVEMAGISEPTRAQLLRIADLAWQTFFWKYRKVSAPILADAYMKAYPAADAGDVPMGVIYDLADKHAEKIGGYFHETSADALAEGFDRLVNTRVPAREAANRVMDAYGLSPRQMRAYTGASQFHTPISDVMPRSLKARARAFIDKSFTQRTRKLSAQEEHNIDEQAKQFAWMWLQGKGRLNEKAQKMWITAKDERVCTICGPLHGQKVGLNDRFRTPEGEFWTPGIHPNCRCVVRLIENRFSKAAYGASGLYGRPLYDFNRQHPRGSEGRFSTKVRTQPQRQPVRTQTIDVDHEFERIISGIPPSPPAHVTYARAWPAEPAHKTRADLDTREQFAELIEAQPKRPRGLLSPLSSPLGETSAKLSLEEDRVVDMAADLAVHLRQEVRRDPKLQPTKTPTIPLVAPHFTFISAEQLANGDIGQLRVNHGMDWSKNDISTALAASVQIRAAEASKVMAIKREGRNRIRMKDRTGTEYVADLDEDAIRRTVGWHVSNATSHWHEHDEPAFDDGVTVDWKLAHGAGGRGDLGEPVALPNWVSYRTLGPRMNIDKKEFEFYVVRADRAPAEEGAVEFIPEEDGGGVTMGGDFELVPGSVDKFLHRGATPLTTFKIEPKGSVKMPEEGE
jgi:hypothetical protein